MADRSGGQSQGEHGMRRYAFTGPSSLTQSQVSLVRSTVHRLSPAPSEITTGCAAGVDTTVALEAMTAWPNALHRIVVPRGVPHNEELVEVFQNLYKHTSPVDIEIVEMPWISDGDELGRRRRSYRARNTRMLEYADELMAYVRQGMFYRSGEWMTINLAEKRGIPAVKLLI